MSLENEKILRNIEGIVLQWKYGIITSTAALDLIYKYANEPRGDYGDNIRMSPYIIKGKVDYKGKLPKKERI